MDWQKKIDDLDLISTAKASNVIGVSDSYLRRLCREKKLACFAADGRYYIPRKVAETVKFERLKKLDKPI